MKKYIKKYKLNNQSFFGLFGTAIVCIWAIIFCVILVDNMWKLQRMTNTVYERPFKENALVLQLRSEIIESRLYISRLLTSQNERMYASVEEHLENIYQKMESEMRQVSSDRIKDHANLAKVYQLIAKIKVAQYKIVEEGLSYSLNQMVDACIKQLNPVYEELNAKIDLIVKESMDSMNHSVYESKYISMAMTVFAIVLLVILIIFSNYFQLTQMKRHKQLYYRDMLFKLFAENTDDVFIIYDVVKDEFEYISENIERIMGVPLKNLYDNFFQCVYECLDRKSTEEIFDIIKEEPDDSTYDREMYLKNPITGENKWMRLRIYPITIDGEVCKYIATAVDLTKDKYNQQLISDALEQAKSANQAKRTFLSQMSHEIRTPMNSIVGMTELAKLSMDNPGKVEEYLNHIESSSSYLMNLLNNILDISKLESEKINLYHEPFCLTYIVKEAVAVFSHQAEQKSIQFDVIIREIRNKNLIGDSMRLKQILINLLSNAIKFTQKGGKVSLEISQMQEKESYARFEFLVKDNGIGMQKNQTEKLFVPFEQTDVKVARKYGGSGLGLAIVKSLLSLIEGTIEVSSEPDIGTTFRIEIPFEIDIEKGNRLADDEKEDDSKNNFANCQILLVEDNEINMEIAGELLKRRGVKVDCAFDGKNAVEQFAASETYQYDMIFMDVQMPNMDGYEATKQIRNMEREDAKTIYIVAMTANAFYDDVADAIESGMNNHITKPIDRTGMNAVFQHYFARNIVKEE